MATHTKPTAYIFSQSISYVLLVSVLAVSLNVLFVSTAEAGTIGAILCTVAGWIFGGTIGAGVSTLAICILGVGAALGKVSWGLAMTVGVGCVVMRNANIIAIQLTGYGC